ncbi:MAG: hypothetical protein D6781_08985 [Verrucomicrobia bacterium]|nr:MAG: hypothetical protein D6781_08985 [Verrucomicrobiota bacterium]
MKPVPDLLPLAREIYEAYAEADLVPLFQALDEHVVWRTHSHPCSPFRGVHVGTEAIQRYFANMTRVDNQRFEVKSLLQAGDRVVALLDVRRVLVETGQVFEGLFVHVWRWKAGRIVEVDIYEASAEVE